MLTSAAVLLSSGPASSRAATVCGRFLRSVIATAHSASSVSSATATAPGSFEDSSTLPIPIQQRTKRVPPYSPIRSSPLPFSDITSLCSPVMREGNRQGTGVSMSKISILSQPLNRKKTIKFRSRCFKQDVKRTSSSPQKGIEKELMPHYCVEIMYDKIDESKSKCSIVPLITLSLRGVLFTLEREVLLQKKGSYFETMLRSNFWRPGSDGSYFIDRPPEIFRIILEYMTSGTLDIEALDEETLSDLQRDLDYFQIAVPCKKRDYSVGNYIPGHRGPVYSLAQLLDGRVCSGSYDCCIKVWNEGLSTCELTLQGHTSAVMSLLVLEDGSLWSASADHTIKSWDLKAKRSIRTLAGHTNVVSCLTDIGEKRICSGSWDTTIKIWTLQEGVCERTLRGHSGWVVTLVLLKDGNLCSGAVDQTVRLWDIVSETCLQSISFPSAVLCLVEISAGSLICGLRSGSVETVDIATQSRSAFEAVGGLPLRFTVALNDGRLCTSGARKERSMQLWSMTKGENSFLPVEPMSEFDFGMMLCLLQLADGKLCGGGAIGGLAIWE